MFQNFNCEHVLVKLSNILLPRRLKRVEQGGDLPGVWKVKAGLGRGEPSCWTVAGEAMVRSLQSPIATQHFFYVLTLLNYIWSIYLQQSFTHWPWEKISKVSLFAESQNWVPVSQGDPGSRPTGRDWWWSCRPHSPWSQCASWWALNVVIILLFCCDNQLRS